LNQGIFKFKDWEAENEKFNFYKWNYGREGKQQQTENCKNFCQIVFFWMVIGVGTCLLLL